MHKLRVVFYTTKTGREPVRDWMASLTRDEKKIVGVDLKTVQFAWPLGMPEVRKLDRGIWEVRSALKGRIARVLFTVQGNSIVLLHGSSRRFVRRPIRIYVSQKHDWLRWEIHQDDFG